MHRSHPHPGDLSVVYIINKCVWWWWWWSWWWWGTLGPEGLGVVQGGFDYTIMKAKVESKKDSGGFCLLGHKPIER